MGDIRITQLETANVYCEATVNNADMVLRQGIDDDRWFEEAVRTVQSVFAQFGDLKRTASTLLKHTTWEDRGYFTPSEDEALRRLLVTYWQLRVALLELVRELRIRGYRNSQSYSKLFLPGYAGALVLLDAARFLREQIHEQPTIRRKLNEPEPSFGLPAGIYDATQESWTLPSHIWELFNAAKFYQQHRQDWSKLQNQPDIESMLGMIETLTSRLNITWSDYARFRLRFRMRQMLNWLQQDLWGTAIYQLQKATGWVAAEKYIKIGHQPGLPISIREELGLLLRPGDVLLCRKEYAITNYFLPGYWPHSAFVVGSDLKQLEGLCEQHPLVRERLSKFAVCDPTQRPRVVEAMKDGVFIRSIDSPFRSDSILVLRPIISEVSKQQAVARAMFHEGKEYDFSFDFSTANRLVCTEVVYRALEGIEGIQFKLQMRAGRMTLAAEDLVQMALKREYLEVVYAFIPKLSPSILRAGAATEAVAQFAMKDTASAIADTGSRNLSTSSSD